MTPEELATLARTIAGMREEVAEFAAEFASLSDRILEQMIKQQSQIIDDAAWRMSCAETELKLRLIKIMCNTPTDAVEGTQ